MNEGGKSKRRRRRGKREEWRDRRPEGGLLEYPLYLWAERERKESQKKEKGDD